MQTSQGLTEVVLVAAERFSSAGKSALTFKSSTFNGKTQKKAYHLAPLPEATRRSMGLQLKPTEAVTSWTGTPIAPKRNAPAAELD